MKTKTKITDIKLGPIKIEVECHGENDYRFTGICQQSQFKDFNIDYDIRIYADTQKIRSSEITEIQLWDDHENIFVKLTDTEYDHIHNQIQSSLTITNWVG